MKSEKIKYFEMINLKKILFAEMSYFPETIKYAEMKHSSEKIKCDEMKNFSEKSNIVTLIMRRQIAPGYLTHLFEKFQKPPPRWRTSLGSTLPTATRLATFGSEPVLCIYFQLCI